MIGTSDVLSIQVRGIRNLSAHLDWISMAPAKVSINLAYPQNVRLRTAAVTDALMLLGSARRSVLLNFSAFQPADGKRCLKPVFFVYLVCNPCSANVREELRPMPMTLCCACFLQVKPRMCLSKHTDNPRPFSRAFFLLRMALTQLVTELHLQWINEPPSKRSMRPR